MPKPTIVLVHGAWADASSWNAVASHLQSEGFTVFAPTNLLRGVSIDAPYITSFLAQRTSGPVVLVGHSYGGFVITNAATGGGDVRALVYVDAFAPDEGETTFGILGGSGSELDVPDPTTVHESFAQDLPDTDRWLIAAEQRPLTLSANTTPSVTAAWKTIPSWAVIGTEDRIIPPDAQRRMAQRAGATTTEVAASHVSMVSKPQAAIDAILAAVAATSD